AVNRNAQITNDAAVFLLFQPYDSVAVWLKVSILGRWSLLGRVRTGIAGIYVDVNYRLGLVRLNPRMQSFQFNRLLGRKRQRIQCCPQDILPPLLIHLSTALHQFDQLRLSAEFIQQENSSTCWQP